MKKRAIIESITASPVRGKVHVILTVFDSPTESHKQSVHMNVKLLEKGQLTMKKIMKRLEIVEKQRKTVTDVEKASHSLIGQTGDFEARS